MTDPSRHQSCEALTHDSSDETNPYGYPDWRDPENYPFHPETTSIKKWKWEFIRRDPEYIKSWKEFGDHLEIKNKDSQAWCIGRKKALSLFGLDHLQHPKRAKQNPFIVAGSEMQNQTILVSFGRDEAERFCERARTNGHILISVDKDLPFEAQFDYFKDEIISWRYELADLTGNEDATGASQKPRVELYIVYLRILDAKGELNLDPPTWARFIELLNEENGTTRVSDETWKKDRFKEARRILKVVRGWPLSNATLG